MDHVLNHIERIKARIQQLGDQYKSVIEKNKELIEINKSLKESLEKVSGEKGRLEAELRELMDAQKAGQGDELSEYKKSFTRELDGYLKELDKCIELVENS